MDEHNFATFKNNLPTTLSRTLSLELAVRETENVEVNDRPYFADIYLPNGFPENSRKSSHHSRPHSLISFRNDSVVSRQEGSLYRHEKIDEVDIRSKMSSKRSKKSKKSHSHSRSSSSSSSPDIESSSTKSNERQISDIPEGENFGIPFGFFPTYLSTDFEAHSAEEFPLPKVWPTWRIRLHELIFYRSIAGISGRILNYFFLFNILISVAVGCITTMPEITNLSGSKITLFIIETTTIVIFTVEFFLHCIAVVHWRELLRWTYLIDVMSFLPFYLELAIQAGQNLDFIDNKYSAQSVAVLSVLRVLRILQLFKFFGKSSKLQLLVDALMNSKDGILLLLYTIPVLVGVFYVNGKISSFQSIPDCFWIVIVTLTTIGYGDVVPITLPGKIIMACVMFISLFIVAFPLTMITMQYSLVVRSHAQKRRQRQERRMKMEAHRVAMKRERERLRRENSIFFRQGSDNELSDRDDKITWTNTDLLDVVVEGKSFQKRIISKEMLRKSEVSKQIMSSDIQFAVPEQNINTLDNEITFSVSKVNYEKTTSDTPTQFENYPSSSLSDTTETPTPILMTPILRARRKLEHLTNLQRSNSNFSIDNGKSLSMKPRFSVFSGSGNEGDSETFESGDHQNREDDDQLVSRPIKIDTTKRVIMKRNRQEVTFFGTPPNGGFSKPPLTLEQIEMEVSSLIGGTGEGHPDIMHIGLSVVDWDDSYDEKNVEDLLSLKLRVRDLEHFKLVMKVLAML
ncbi:Potassium voltage-gated channel sub S member 3, partial [Nowakowskiella sp. JEL0078]